MKNNSLLKLLKKIHEDENGTVSLETILIIGAMALVILGPPVGCLAADQELLHHELEYLTRRSFVRGATMIG